MAGPVLATTQQQPARR